LEYVDKGDLPSAFASMTSDLSKHPETCTPVMEDVLTLGMMLLAGGHLSTQREMRDWINGFQ
jgi:hypothetical protein